MTTGKPENPLTYNFRYKRLMGYAQEAARLDRSHQWVLRRVRRSLEAARAALERFRGGSTAR